MAFQNGDFCWNECGTQDVAAAKKFYSAMFGWAAVDVPMPEGMPGTYTLFKVDDKDVAGLFELTEECHPGMPPNWAVYMWADDVDAFAGKVKERGGSVIADPCDVPGVGRIAVCADPTGAMFQLFRGSEHPGAAADMEGRHGGFCWREVITSNPDAAGKFYTDLFGWGSKANPNVPGGGYTEFTRGVQSFAGMMPLSKEWGDIPSHWSSYVTVDDAAKAAETATASGGKVLVPPTEIPGDVGTFTLVSDPSGARISAIKLNLPG